MKKQWLHKNLQYFIKIILYFYIYRSILIVACSNNPTSMDSSSSAYTFISRGVMILYIGSYRTILCKKLPRNELYINFTEVNRTSTINRSACYNHIRIIVVLQVALLDSIGRSLHAIKSCSRNFFDCFSKVHSRKLNDTNNFVQADQTKFSSVLFFSVPSSKTDCTFLHRNHSIFAVFLQMIQFGASF